MGDDLVARAEADHQSAAVLKKLGLGALPIDVESIAESHRITVARAACDGPSGCLVRVGDTFGVLLSTSLHNDGFERFTLGHELGHFFMPGHTKKLFPGGAGQHISRSGFHSADGIEREADYFAASLLMPEAPFRAALRKAGTGFPAVERMAATCRTSLTATAIRFATFSEDPVAVIVSEKGQVRFCFLSSALEDLEGVRRAAKRSAIPRRSETHAYHSDPAKILARTRSEGESNLSSWLEGAPDLRVDEDVVGLGEYGRVLTVLHTTEALAEEEDEDDLDD